ncbi:MAG: sigma-70 family RNA polymerase sigma factor [Clostridia bacterium]|nr:sigma-70 family RNA polymerase sigma factor [Clostridia bacterium]
MTNERANELFREYRKTGDKAIRNELIENYMYVAQILAKKFAGRGVDYDDLLQIASEALISGVEKFDPDLGYMFSTYVTPTITGCIRNYFRDYSRSVRVPRKLYALSAKVKEAVNEFYKVNGVKPTVKQLSEQLGESEETILEAMECRAPVSLDSTVKGEDNDVPLYEVIADGRNSFESFEDNESLKTEIAKLSPIEREVVALRYIQGKSQAEAGKILGVSQMFVSRAEHKIIEKLREALSK